MVKVYIFAVFRTQSLGVLHEDSHVAMLKYSCGLFLMIFLWKLLNVVPAANITNWRTSSYMVRFLRHILSFASLFVCVYGVPRPRPQFRRNAVFRNILSAKKHYCASA